MHAKVGCVTLHSVVHQGLVNKALKYYLKGKVWKEVQSALKDLEVSAGGADSAIYMVICFSLASVRRVGLVPSTSVVAV